jgi:predicted DNA-binding transcriptional regulator YafY
VKRLDRLLSIALLLSARRRLKAQALAEHFQISLRTVYRDVRSLVEAGFPIVGTPGDGYLLPSSSQLKPLAMDPGEAEALIMASRVLDAGADEALRARLAAAVAKLEAVLPPEAVRRLREHRGRVMMVPGPPRRTGPIGVFLEAVASREVVAIVYQAVGGECTRREIEPLGLVQLGGEWVVPAYCRLRDDWRVFRVAQVHEASLTGVKYPPREANSLNDFIDIRERSKRN